MIYKILSRIFSGRQKPQESLNDPCALTRLKKMHSEQSMKESIKESLYMQALESGDDELLSVRCLTKEHTQTLRQFAHSYQAKTKKQDTPQQETPTYSLASGPATWLAQVAEHRATPLEILQKLSTHCDPDVRMAVADNPSTPVHVLWIMAADDSVDIRYAIAENHNCPEEVLESLLEDANPYIACRARRTLDRLRGGQVYQVNFERQSRREQSAYIAIR